MNPFTFSGPVCTVAERFGYAPWTERVPMSTCAVSGRSLGMVTASCATFTGTLGFGAKRMVRTPPARFVVTAPFGLPEMVQCSPMRAEESVLTATEPIGASIATRCTPWAESDFDAERPGVGLKPRPMKLLWPKRGR